MEKKERFNFSRKTRVIPVFLDEKEPNMDVILVQDFNKEKSTFSLFIISATEKEDKKTKKKTMVIEAVQHSAAPKFTVSKTIAGRIHSCVSGSITDYIIMADKQHMYRYNMGTGEILTA